MGLPTLIIATSAALLGCGDNLVPLVAPDAATVWLCDRHLRIDHSGTMSCYGAQLFAARDTTELVPSQQEIARYFDRWSRAADAEPILRGRVPQDYRLRPPTNLDISTLNPLAISAWSQQVIVTGDSTLDSTIAELEPTAINSFFSNPGGLGAPWIFSLTAPVIRNEEILSRRLVEVGSSIPDPEILPQDDGEWAWLGSPVASGDDDSTAQVDFTFGWGDCFVGCDGFHRLRALVPPASDATVYDMGGDELPSFLMLSPMTKPPP